MARVQAANISKAARGVLTLPDPRPEDIDFTRVREHDLEEIWEQERLPHVAASYASRLGLLTRLLMGRAGPEARVLDVGCAQGTLGLLLASRGYHVTLLDIRPGHIAYAKERYGGSNVVFRVGRLEESLSSETFDCIFLCEVIEHIRAPADLLHAIRRRLKDAATLVVTTPNADFALGREPSYGHAFQSVVDEMDDASADGSDHRFAYSQAELVSVVRASGFRVDETGFFVPFWLSGHLKTRYLYRLLGTHLTLRVGVPDFIGNSYLHRRLCSSQFLVARPR